MNIDSLVRWSPSSQYSSLVVVITELQDAFTRMPPVYSAGPVPSRPAISHSGSMPPPLPPGWERRVDAEVGQAR